MASNIFRYTLLIVFVLVCCSLLTSADAAKINEKATKCLPKDRKQAFCREIYQPVCGYKPNIRCFTTPCNHVTYSNKCVACKDVNVESYTVGKCTLKD